MTFTLGFSPCPNDTFIFDALVNQKIATGGLSFEVVLEDVQTLNRWAREGRLDISKISYGVLPKVTGEYAVLHSGGALGQGVGPLLISDAPPHSVSMHSAAMEQVVNQGLIAIPGEDTTAHFLFSQAFPLAKNKVFMRFDEIEEWLLAKNENAAMPIPSEQGHSNTGIQKFGVIIHENRFTYQQKGLHKIKDLGEYWEKATGNPIPLGGIVMNRRFDVALQQKVDNLIRLSLSYAFDHYPAITEYVRRHAQEMSEAVMRQHIDLYVNDYTLGLGNKGEAAVLWLMKTLGGRDYLSKEVFVPAR